MLADYDRADVKQSTERASTAPGGATATPNLRVAKRRVPVRVQLADQATHDGYLYADLYRLDGAAASVVDRLNDPLEDYLPLATGDEHLLLGKAAIVTVRVGIDQILIPTVEGAKALGVRIQLANRTGVEGTIHAILAPARSRALDYLNETAHRFIPLVSGNTATLVNRRYIVGMTEVRGGTP